MNNWTTDIPTEPGWYWFYGQRYDREGCELAVVRAWQAANAVVCVCGGAFMGESDLGKIRWFQRMTEPEAP